MVKLEGQHLAPRHKAKKLVIFLHGYGATGNDLFSLTPYFADSLLGDAYFIAPDAPYPFELSPSFGRQWFGLSDRSEESLLKGVQNASEILTNFITEKLSELNLKFKDVILIGFSQGSMLAMHTALYAKETIPCVIAYSGALIAPHLLKSTTAKPHICLIHGEDDQVVPFESFEQTLLELQQAGIPVQAFSRKDLGHGIDEAGISIGRHFIKETLIAA